MPPPGNLQRTFLKLSINFPEMERHLGSIGERLKKIRKPQLRIKGLLRVSKRLD
jgi:hypothetical protein